MATRPRVVREGNHGATELKVFKTGLFHIGKEREFTDPFTSNVHFIFYYTNSPNYLSVFPGGGCVPASLLLSSSDDFPAASLGGPEPGVPVGETLGVEGVIEPCKSVNEWGQA